MSGLLVTVVDEEERECVCVTTLRDVIFTAFPFVQKSKGPFLQPAKRYELTDATFRSVNWVSLGRRCSDSGK